VTGPAIVPERSETVAFPGLTWFNRLNASARTWMAGRGRTDGVRGGL